MYLAQKKVGGALNSVDMFVHSRRRTSVLAGGLKTGPLHLLTSFMSVIIFPLYKHRTCSSVCPSVCLLVTGRRSRNMVASVNLRVYLGKLG